MKRFTILAALAATAAVSAASNWRSDVKSNEFDGVWLAQAHAFDEARTGLLYVKCDVQAKEITVAISIGGAESRTGLTGGKEVRRHSNGEMLFQASLQYLLDDHRGEMQVEYFSLAPGIVFVFGADALALARKLAHAAMFVARKSREDIYRYDLTGSREHIAKVLEACGHSLL